MRWQVRDLARIGITAALAVVIGLALKAVPLPRMPYGGSLSLESLPILYLAFTHSAGAAGAAGALCGLIQLAFGAHIYHPIQILLDYPLAFGLLGLAGRLRPIPLGCLLGGSARFVAHFTSGVVFFAAYAPEGTPVWIYSALYNALYLLPEIILSALILPILLRRTAST